MKHLFIIALGFLFASLLPGIKEAIGAPFPKNAPVLNSPQSKAVSFKDKIDVFYVGIDNPITVFVSGYRADKITVTASGGGTLRPDIASGPFHYLYRPDGSQKEFTFTIAARQKNGTMKILNVKKYRIRKIPLPKVLFGIKEDGDSITLSEINAVKQVNAGYGEDFVFEGMKINVNSYTLIIYPLKGDKYIEEDIGNQLPAATKEIFAKLNVGDKILITNVNAMGPTGKLWLAGAGFIVK